VTIPRPVYLFNDPEADDVLMHDDLEDLVNDAKAVYKGLGSLVALLRESDGSENAQAWSREGTAVLIDGLRLRMELVVAGAEGVWRVVQRWAADNEQGDES
jgi:hypothetical protein